MWNVKKTECASIQTISNPPHLAPFTPSLGLHVLVQKSAFTLFVLAVAHVPYRASGLAKAPTSRGGAAGAFLAGADCT
jgi:hypothetical protein